MNALLSSSEWLGDQLGNVAEVVRERESRFASFVSSVRGCESPFQAIVEARNNIFIDPKEDTVCYYSGTITSQSCLKKLSKRTADIIRIFEESIAQIRHGYFYTPEIQEQLDVLKEKTAAMIGNKSVDYYEYLQLVLGYSRNKIHLQLGRLEEFFEENREGDAGVEYFAGLVENMMGKQERKKRPMSVGRPGRKEPKQKKEKEEEKEKEKVNPKGALINNILSCYQMLDLSKAQLTFYLDFTSEQQHKERLLLILGDRNKHIKEQIKVHLEDTEGIDSKIKMVKSSSAQVPFYNRYKKSIQFFQNPEIQEEGAKPEKLKKSMSNPRRKSLSNKKSKITNFQFQFTSSQKKLSKSNYLSTNSKPTTTSSIKSRSHAKIIKSRARPQDPKEIFEPKKLSSRQFRNKMNQAKTFWESYSIYNDPSLFNHTVPVKNLRMKRHVKVNLLQVVKPQ